MPLGAHGATCWMTTRGSTTLPGGSRAKTDWDAEQRVMYERRVAVPRLFGRVHLHGVPPIVGAMAKALSERYRTRFISTTFALYRDGNDSVAWHRDRDLCDRDEATIAI